MAHMYGTDGMRRLYLRGRANIRKRLLVHACGFNLGVLITSVNGAGTPCTLQRQDCQPTANLGFTVCLPFRDAWSGLLGMYRGLLGLRRGERLEFAEKLA